MTAESKVPSRRKDCCWESTHDIKIIATLAEFYRGHGFAERKDVVNVMYNLYT